MKKEKISLEEKTKEVEFTLGRTNVIRLQMFRDECEIYGSQLEELLHSKSEGPIKDFFSGQCYFLDSLKNISKQMIECFGKGAGFEIMPGNEKGENLAFVPKVITGISKIEGDSNGRKFNFLFYSILSDDEEKIEEMQESLRDGKPVILKYNKNKG